MDHSANMDRPANMDHSYGCPGSGRCNCNAHDNYDAPTAATLAATTQPESFLLDNIIVGYAFGPKKMETMGLIMAEASKTLSTFECAGNLSSILNRQRRSEVPLQQQTQQHFDGHVMEDASTATTGAASMLTSQAAMDCSHDNADKESMAPSHCFSDADEDTRSMSSTYTRASFMSQRSRGAGGNNNMNGIQLAFLPDSSGAIHLVRADSSGGVAAGEGESMAGSSVTTSATNPSSVRRRGISLASCASGPMSLASSFSSRDLHESLGSPMGRQKCGRISPRHSTGSGCRNSVQRHPIRVSFVPIDLDMPLEEQHGGKFDVILHKMTEDILCMSKLLRSRGFSSAGVEEAGQAMLGCEGGGSEERTTEPSTEDPGLFEATPSMTRHQARASRRIQRLREYKHRVQPSCVLVDSPSNILAVMSRADMAEVLSRCLASVTTKGGIPVRTPRFRVVNEDIILQVGGSIEPEHADHRRTLADEIDGSGFEYPLIAKPLTAAGTKSSHHMGIVLARDGLQRLKTPCLLQEYANHGETLFKVYVLGDSVWVFSRESLPNLPSGEKELEGEEDSQDLTNPRKRPRTESYVEFERPAGSRCYVEFNSQRPYPKLCDFGIISQAGQSSAIERRAEAASKTSASPKECPQSTNPRGAEYSHSTQPSVQQSPDLARLVTKEEIEPVTNALRKAFGLEMFGFDVLVKHDPSKPNKRGAKEILVVDVNYFPGYKEVPRFPSLLAQYLTQKAVESRLRNFDGS